MKSRLPCLLLLASLLLAGCLADAQLTSPPGDGGSADAPAETADTSFQGIPYPPTKPPKPFPPTKPPTDPYPSPCKRLPARGGRVCGRDGLDYSSAQAACIGGTTPQCNKRCPCTRPTPPPGIPPPTFPPPSTPPPTTPPPLCPGCAAVACPAVYQPVCCGGITFGNSCSASCCAARGCRSGECA
ncbi:hypothetical protein D9Q98_006276 [Chlorella vulgaris]|uniref:Kazal-like domain-containing protein n=1 Tax=Chlorella vulgaris TaxID=3077 RepID=A0A9D4TXK2_CHLVU|nr:hypothetical protein D9Q98_006276 [Chlorella vulgaris]